MNNKLHAVDSSATPTQARAYGGPATVGVEWDRSATVQALVLSVASAATTTDRRTVSPTFYNAGAPTSGTSGTFVGKAPQGAVLFDTTNKVLYMNTNTIASPTWTQIAPAGNQSISITTQAGDGAISPTSSATYKVTKGSAAALTLAAPSADGVEITITSQTAFAHVLTATGLLQTGSSAVNTATFTAFAGATVTLLSINSKWSVTAANGVSFA